MRKKSNAHKHRWSVWYGDTVKEEWKRFCFCKERETRQGLTREEFSRAVVIDA